jgi:hypothetical protein
MAGPLTWRNVDAPDARVALRGIGQSTYLITKALQGAGAGLGAFKDQRAEAADQAALAESMKFTDPAAYQAALKAGQIPQANMTSAGTAALGNRLTQMLQQAAGEQGLVKGEIGIRQAEQDILTGQQGLESGAIGLQRDQKTLDFMDSVEGRAALASQNLNLASQQSLKQGKFNLMQDRYDQDIKVLGDVRQEQGYQDTEAAAASYRALQDSPDTQAAFEGLLAAKEQLTPKAFDMLRKAVDAKFKTNDFTGQTGQVDAMGRTIPGTEAYAPGSHGTRAGNPADAVIGDVGSPIPISQMSAGEVVQFGKDVLIPGNKGKFGNKPDEGSSATGAFQITGGTLKEYGPKVLGEGWENVPFSLYNQDKIAEAIFNDRKGGNLKGTWQGLDDTTPGAYKDVPWSEMRQKIAGVESSGRGGPALPPVRADQVRATELLGKQTTDKQKYLSGAAEAAVKNQGNDADAFAVAKELATEIGGDADNIRDQIRIVQDKIQSNPATAAALIKRSLTRANFLARNVGSVGTDNVSEDQVIDQPALNEYIAAYKSGKSFDQAMSIESGKAGQQTVAQLSEQGKAANITAGQFAARAQRGDAGYAEAAQRAQAKANKLNELLTKALQAQNRTQ